MLPGESPPQVLTPRVHRERVRAPTAHCCTSLAAPVERLPGYSTFWAAPARATESAVERTAFAAELHHDLGGQIGFVRTHAGRMKERMRSDPAILIGSSCLYRIV